MASEIELTASSELDTTVFNVRHCPLSVVDRVFYSWCWQCVRQSRPEMLIWRRRARPKDGAYLSVGGAAFSRSFPRLYLHSASPATTIMSDRNPYDLRASYTRFRILVIGRANAGKTTLLQRVCNTTDDPCVYDENNKNLVSTHWPEEEFCLWHYLLAWTYLSGTPLTNVIY